MNSLLLYPFSPLRAVDGYIVGAGFGELCNSSTASGEGTPEINTSNFKTTLILVIS